jgi:hypothetical protein
METIHKLRSSGYDVFIEEEGLKYLYRGADSPSPDQIIPLIELLKTHKQEIINDPYFLIDSAITEINEEWRPGTLEWLKGTRPIVWQKITTLEEKINSLTLKRNVTGLKQALGEYKELILTVIALLGEAK